MDTDIHRKIAAGVNVWRKVDGMMELDGYHVNLKTLTSYGTSGYMYGFVAITFSEK